MSASSPVKGKTAAAGSSKIRFVDATDPRRSELVIPFPGYNKKRESPANFPLYFGIMLTACTLLLRNRVYALPALMFGLAACFNAESLFPEGGMGPMQVVTFAGLALSTAYTPLLLDLTPRKLNAKTPLPMS